jgi:hypothetical protein
LVEDHVFSEGHGLTTSGVACVIVVHVLAHEVEVLALVANLLLVYVNALLLGGLALDSLSFRKPLEDSMFLLGLVDHRYEEG